MHGFTRTMTVVSAGPSGPGARSGDDTAPQLAPADRRLPIGATWENPRVAERLAAPAAVGAIRFRFPCN